MLTDTQTIIRGDRERFRKYAPADVFDRITELDSVPALLERCAREYADMEAVRYDGNTWTYSALLADVEGFRAAIAGAGLPRGRRVMLHMPNSYDLLVAFLAVTSSGMSAIVAPPQLPPQAIAGMVGMFGCTALVDSQPQEAPYPVFSGKERVSGACPAVAADPGQECVILFTGGTTGKSKGASLSHRAVMQGVVNGCYGYSDVFGQRYLLNLPMSHVFGLIRGTLTSMYTGSSVLICKNPQTMFRDAAAFRPTLWIAVPAMAEMALSLSRQFGRMMLGPDMRSIICGAAAVPPYLVEEYAKYGIALFPGYGLTESANLVSGNPEFRTRPSSVGLPFPNQELCIRGGELWLRGKNMLTAYLGTSEPTFDEDGWFHTGYLARFDEDGFLYINGRTKEIIVLDNGENISPAEIESRFNELACVQDTMLYEEVSASGRSCLVLEAFPRAAELAGVEDPKAYVLAKLQEINRTLPTSSQAAQIRVRDTDFERSPSMKIVRVKKKYAEN